MPKKNTSHLENELKNSTSLDIFLEEHQEELTHCSLSEQLVTMLESKGLTKAEVSLVYHLELGGNGGR